MLNNNDPMMNMDPEEAILQEGAAPWDALGEAGATTNNKEPTIDLSAFNKDYIMKGLARLYRKKILPLELSSRYGHFHSPPMSPADFDAPPAVLLLGPFRYVLDMHFLFSAQIMYIYIYMYST